MHQGGPKRKEKGLCGGVGGEGRGQAAGVVAVVIDIRLVMGGLKIAVIGLHSPKSSVEKTKQ